MAEVQKQYNIPTERISLGEDAWWEIYTDMPYGVQRQIRATIGNAVRMEMGDGKGTTGSISLDIADQMNTVRLLRCTVAWSFPEAVDEDGLNGRRGKHVQAVLDRMDVLYAAESAEKVAAQKKV